MSFLLTSGVLQERANLATKEEDPAFKFTVNTELEGSASDTFVLPTTESGYDAIVDWGDGQSESVTGTPGDITHVYSSPGIYQLSITGTFPHIFFNSRGDCLKLLSIENWGDVGFSSNQSYAYENCTNLASPLPEDHSDFFNNTLINGQLMFRDCRSIEKLPTAWTLDAIENTFMMFYYATSLTTIPNVTFASVTSGLYIFGGVTLFTEDYSNLLINIEANNPNNDVSFYGGSSQYNSSAQTARDNLIARGWNITDGGLAS